MATEANGTDTTAGTEPGRETAVCVEQTQKRLLHCFRLYDSGRTAMGPGGT